MKGILNRIANAANPDNIELFANQVKDFVNYMEHAAAELKNKLNVSTIFTTPPGFHQWNLNFQQFAYAVTWVTNNRGIDIVITGANLRIDRTTLRPCELSYPAMLAEMYKCLQAYDSAGNVQLTSCDSTAFDHGMEMAKETFSIHGERRLRESPQRLSKKQ